MKQKLIDASKLHYIQALIHNPKTGAYKPITVVRASEINKAETVRIASTKEAISKKDLQKAINKINKCSIGKWYVGRTDGKIEEVVLLEDVLNVLTDLMNKGANNE